MYKGPALDTLWKYIREDGGFVGVFGDGNSTATPSVVMVILCSGAAAGGVPPPGAPDRPAPPLAAAAGSFATTAAPDFSAGRGAARVLLEVGRAICSRSPSSLGACFPPEELPKKAS
mgnify:CR=1 FL=1